MDIKGRITELRREMQMSGIDIYIVPTADFHQTEYVGEYFKARKFITGFSGSAGTAVITQTDAGLWTDGRYFIQASEQIEGTPIRLFKMGEPGVPTISEYIKDNLPNSGTVGFDGRVVSMDEGIEYKRIADEKGGQINFRADLIDKIWNNRPELSKEKAFRLDVKYAGESVHSKLKRIRSEMKKHDTDIHIIATIDDICWMLNIRGNDITYFPLVLSYAIITKDVVHLYIDESKIEKTDKKILEEDGVIFHAYDNFYKELQKQVAENKVMLDPNKVNYYIYSTLADKVVMTEVQNPTILFKAIKNDVEIANNRIAQIKDSICHIKFMKWVKENYDKTDITELNASDKLDELREAQGNYIRPSFAPICAYAAHSASPHYESSKETNVKVEAGNFFLTDTGAGYLEGSTDITRTYAIGEVTKEMKKDFTLVAISNLNLSSGKFMYGSTGMVLDILARKPFWDRNINFNHGTGHGLGYLLSIHEPPTGFRWQHRDHESHQFEAGMVITNEPGIYKEGSHGVRLENELLVCNGEKNEYGQFMYFEPITYIPFDLDAIIPEMMSEEDKKMLNDYHKEVYKQISPHLDLSEREWLKEYTREV